MSTATRIQEPEMGLTFEKVWAALLKSQEDFDRRMRESRENFDREMRESRENFDQRTKEADRQLQETRQLIGDLGRKFGSAVEHMVAPNLVEKFNALGFNFTKYGPNIAISDKTRKLAAEVDVFLENGDCAIAVEVKAQLKIDDVKEHVERMQVLRRYADAH
ncbi:MAG: hypothetical protein LBQ42_01425, partial [Synergistaceae bacterium]|nr:hypothetical protein [Synergistaceae bacterium]